VGRVRLRMRLRMEVGRWKMEDGRESADDDLRNTKYEVGSTK
jgi:hypothetical protein